MDKLDEILNFSESCCKNKMFHMCSIRTKELRDCAMSKCCGYCYKVLECDGVCLKLTEKFSELKNIKLK